MAEEVPIYVHLDEEAVVTPIDENNIQNEGNEDSQWEDVAEINQSEVQIPLPTTHHSGEVVLTPNSRKNKIPGKKTPIRYRRL